jgi:acetyl esterase/lipase
MNAARMIEGGGRSRMKVSDRVETETVEVGSAGDRTLLADLYRPPQPNGAGVLLVHGGGWIQGDRSQLRGYGILLGRIGYTCLACEYRLAPGATWPAQIDDVNAALRYLHAQAPALGIDPAKIAVSGNSAGGHLALMAAAQPVAPIAAVVAFYPPTDMIAGLRRGGEELMTVLFSDPSESQLAAASPITFARADFQPAMHITGNHDELVSWHDSDDMYHRLRGAGAKAELHVFEGLPHAFDRLPDYGRHCANLIGLFLDRHVREPRVIDASTVAV